MKAADVVNMKTGEELQVIFIKLHKVLKGIDRRHAATFGIISQ